MARKRKSRGAETPQDPQPQPEEPPQIPQPEEEDPPAEEEVVEEVEEREDDEEEREGEDEDGEEEEEEEEEEDEQDGGEGEEDEPSTNPVDETKTVADPVKNELQTEITEKPSEENAAVSENGGEDEGEDEEEEPLEKLLEPFSKDQLALIIKEAVAKHPDVIENVHKVADSDPSHRKIFVHGLGWEANDETITSEFGKYGVIEDCKVVRDKASGKSKGYGFILFKHRQGAKKALKQPQKLIQGRMTSCQLASAGPVRTGAAPAVAPVVSGPPVSEYTQRKIYISNVSAELDPNKLMEFFSKFGEIEEGPLGLDKQTGKPRGFCLFVYKSAESARKALEEPHKNFEGQILHCQKAVDGPKHTKGHFNQQQQSQPHQQQQRPQQGNQGYYGHAAKKGRYSGRGDGGAGHTGGHLMAPSGGPSMPSMGYNPTVAPAAIGQAVAALLATQGAGLGIGNFLGGIGAGNQQGVPPMMNNAAYGAQGGGAGGYGGHPAMQGGYAGQPQMGQGGVRPNQSGAPYMGRGGR